LLAIIHEENLSKNFLGKLDFFMKDRVDGEKMDNFREKLLKGNDIARILNISRAKAYKLMMNGEISVVRFGKSVRVIDKDLEDFIEKHKVLDL
jgi:excisionase family DNA binding protein